MRDIDPYVNIFTNIYLSINHTNFKRRINKSKQRPSLNEGKRKTCTARDLNKGRQRTGVRRTAGEGDPPYFCPETAEGAEFRSDGWLGEGAYYCRRSPRRVGEGGVCDRYRTPVSAVLCAFPLNGQDIIKRSQAPFYYILSSVSLSAERSIFCPMNTSLIMRSPYSISQSWANLGSVASMRSIS